VTQTLSERGPGLGRVALVHDYLTQLGGAERVAGVMASRLPSARLLTSIHRANQVPLSVVGNRAWETSFLQPLGRVLPLKSLLPLLPLAIPSLDVSDRDLVVSSSSAFAHHIRPREGATHVCYCAAPAHFLWNQTEYFRGRPGLAAMLSPLLKRLRRLDLKAAARVDVYLANSGHTARRIREVYGREARIVYPPVDLSRFRPTSERSGRFVVVSRLVRSKRVDLVVDAANRFGLPLDVFGAGPELAELRRRAGATVRLPGWQPDKVVSRAMAECVALVVAGEEDFGITMVEAQASGRPPVAFAAGGALEIVEDGLTGYLFHDQTPEALGEAMIRARDGNLDTADLHTSAARFDTTVFCEAFLGALADALQPQSAGLMPVVAQSR
jgi:glycosyltransferase involved in cell wall biosynthesis